MRHGMGLALLCMLLAQQASATGAEGVATEGSQCPAAIRVAPSYPADMIEQGQGGTVLLDAVVDGCGRVMRTEVKAGSGFPSLDQAAQVAVRQWVVGGDDRSSTGGHLEIPVAFNMEPARKLRYGDPDWPSSHKRPRYVLEELPGFKSPAEVLATYHFSPEKMITAPYPGVRNLLFRQASDNPVEYWLFIYRKPDPTVAVRYRLVMEHGEPVVRMAFLCDNAPRTCARDRKFLMKGLPFAKAR
ncbi:MAG: energy transducer TonB [Pseudoxanthomonas sp.]